MLRAGLGVAIVDGEGGILVVNERLLEMLGYTLEELQLLHFKDITHSEDVVKDLHLYEKLTSGQISYYNLRKRYVRKGGSVMWGDLTVSPVPSSKEHAAVALAIVKDVTRDVEREERIRQVNEDLERFAYVASHDLKQPLRVVSTFSDLLARRYGEGMGKRFTGYLDKVRKGANEAATLIDDVLEYSRAGRPLDNPSTLNLAKVARACLESHQVHVIFEARGRLRVQMVKVHAQALINNLISNSIKYASPERDLVIRMTGKEKEGKLHILYENNGRPLSPLIREKIFEPFKYLPENGEGGSGIGMSICDRVVKQYGGTIQVVDKEEGVAFMIQLPIPCR
jgi:PAS domain S-box-containing protein